MALSITILPVDAGWTLRSPALGADMFFSRGGRAEAGQAVELEVVLRDGTVAGVIPFPAAPAANL